MKIRIDSRGNLYKDNHSARCPFCDMEACGTWCALFTVVISSEGHAGDIGICTMYADESSEANARLISAAPDLVKASQEVLFCDGYNGHALAPEARKIIYAALAKAGIE